MLPLLSILFILALLTALVAVMSAKPLQSIVKSGAIAITIAALLVLLVFMFELFWDTGFIIVAVIIMFIGMGIATLISICNVFRLIRNLTLKREPVNKYALLKIATYSMVAIMGLLIAIPNIYVLFPHTHSWEKIDGTKSKMYALALSLKEFSTKTKGCYPSHLNTRVSDVSKDLKLTSGDSSSVTGYRTSDTVYANNIGTSGPTLLPNKERFKNVYGDSKPVLIISKTDPPVWDEKCMGAVYYVPIDVKGNIAKSFKIYGSGNKGLFPTALEPGDIPKDK